MKNRGSADKKEDQLAEILQNQQELTRLSAVARQTTNGVIITDTSGRIQWVNEGFTRITGYTLRESKGLIPGDFLQGAETDPETVAIMARALSRDQGFDVDIINYNKQGTLYWIRINCTPLLGSQGEIEGFLAIQSDITKEKTDAERIRRSERRLASVIDGTDIGTWEWNIPKNSLVVNHRWAEMVGYSLEELVPVTTETRDQLIHPEDLKKSQDSLEKHFSGELDRYDCKIRVRHKLGQWIWVHARGQVLDWSPEKAPILMYGTHIDITKEVEAERALRSSLHLQSIGQLAGGVAHDFNNLLSVILANAELLKQLSTNEDFISPLESIHGATLRGRDLNRRLLAFAQRALLKAHPCPLTKVFEDLDLLIARTIPENIDFHRQPGDDLWDPIVDPIFLESALLNLILNATQAMPDGGTIIVSATNEYIDSSQKVHNDYGQALLPGRYVKLTISDTGSGIPPEILSQVIEPFFSTREKAYSSGLGLAMVHGFCIQSGGLLSLESTLGKGTSVHLLLPASVGKEDSLMAPRSEEVKLPRDRRAQLLLVEDDDLVRKSLKRLLQQAGYQVETCSSGDSAWETLQNHDRRWDLVLTDIVMPGAIQGIELADRITTLPFPLPVLIMTGHTDRFSRPVLQKPISRKDLLRAIQGALEVQT